MILTLVAELIAGETLLTDGGPVDGATATGHDAELWGVSHLAPAELVREVDAVRARIEEPVA